MIHRSPDPLRHLATNALHRARLLRHERNHAVLCWITVMVLLAATAILWSL